MKRDYFLGGGLLAAGLLASLILAPLASAQDMAVTAGSNAKVVLDNDKVRVIELNMPPGATTGVHSHEGDSMVVFLSGGSATQTQADGSTKTLDRKPGDVMWSGPATHETKNTGKKPTRTLVIELK
ncbi:cupin domain-containing protein [Agrilutibacter solisilvae]|uniref:Cupin domain-containing protein n=1 Tax=Agrilutibacter solisilvae TaxID=2763317 RepID=A0A974Y063_9GAMM|nr:cupin domain-containing protein [Lysobacter solisilvae]QSX78899.1 cupin domain-containing protein [Lysobacter solisilvae]